MKIAFFSTIRGYPWGGADAIWTRAAQAAAESGHSVLAIVSTLVAPSPHVDALRRQGARVYVRPSQESMAFTARLARRTRRMLGRPDPIVGQLDAFDPGLVVVSCGGTYDALVAEPALGPWLERRKGRTRYICNLQVEHPELCDSDLARVRALFGAAEKIFFVSERNRERTLNHLAMALPQAEVLAGCTVHNPVVPAVAPAWPQGPVARFAYVGRLEAIKGVDILVRAAAAAFGTQPGWHLDLFGRGPLAGPIEALISELGLGRHVAIRGFVPDFEDIWRDNHMMVSAALEEGIPMTLPEAMGRGRPALATRVGGAEEWIVPGETGYLCDAPTVDGVAGALSRALADRTHWQRMGERAALRVRERFDPLGYLRAIA